MDRETLLESVLNATIERMGHLTKNYEAEIANLTAETMILKNEISKLNDEISTLQSMSVSVGDIRKSRSAFKIKEDNVEEVEEEVEEKVEEKQEDV